MNEQDLVVRCLYTKFMSRTKVKKKKTTIRKAPQINVELRGVYKIHNSE